jgi:hypothetical protein
LEELDIQKIVEKFDPMKLSVCIPVYNFDVRELVFDLKKKLKTII